MRLCVVIVNYRKPVLTIDCLKSIEPELADCPELRVVVVDNASGDDSLEALNAARLANGWESWLTIIESPANLGFAGGNNIGIRSEEANAYLLLNNDTIVLRGAFALMLETLEANSRVGLVGPGILDPDGTPHVSCFRNRTPVSEMLGAAKTGPLTKLFRRFDVPLPISGTCEPVWIGFACVLVRREVFEDIGLLDDSYFMYFEDIDFCIRARKAGWRILHDPRPQVIHLEGGSSDVISSFQGRKRVAKFYYESRARYFATHYGGRPGLWFANVLWMLGRCVSLLREVAGAKTPHTAAHEGRDNWTNWMHPRPRKSDFRNGFRPKENGERNAGEQALQPMRSEAHGG
jgi:N-acetylglucosaminyl-diphospho-decaprenol L-rhamnosyltransferase